MKHDFDVNGKLVKWKYISDFYERDAKQMVKLAPKLTDKRMNLPPFAAMRVRLATQVFSHSVAAGVVRNPSPAKCVAVCRGAHAHVAKSRVNRQVL